MSTETNINDSVVSAKQEIQNILSKYNVALIPTIIHQGDQTFSRIDIVPRQENPESVAPAAEAIEEK